MPSYHVTNNAAITRILIDPNGGIARDMRRRGRNVERVAKTIVHRRTNRLASSITTQMLRPIPIARVGTDVHYAPYHHDGTGIYGPRRQPIRPKTGKYLVFVPYGSKRPIFVKQVLGQRGTNFLLLALPAARQ